MNLDEKKKALLDYLQKQNINVFEDDNNKNMVIANGFNLWVTRNYGGQVNFPDSKTAITTIRTESLEDIKYNGFQVDFFAIPFFGRTATSSKKEELGNCWCFIPSKDIYQLIKDFVGEPGTNWTTSPSSNWTGNISKKKFYWKSDLSNSILPVVWDDASKLMTNRVVISNIEKDIIDIENDDFLSDTQKKRLINVRIGQGKYRDDLIELWGGCCVTKICDSTLLIASHIKPWRSSNNQERLDEFNGLLLTPHFDALFDKGLISFTDKGGIIFSSKLSSKVKEAFMLDSNIHIAVKNENIKYLAFHRDEVFQS